MRFRLKMWRYRRRMRNYPRDYNRAIWAWGIANRIETPDDPFAEFQHYSNHFRSSGFDPDKYPAIDYILREACARTGKDREEFLAPYWNASIG